MLATKPVWTFNTSWSVGQNAPTRVIRAPNTSENPFLSWAVQLENQNEVPLVHSVSFGSYEFKAKPEEVFQFNLEMQKLALRGVTVASKPSGMTELPTLQPEATENCGYYPVFCKLAVCYYCWSWCKDSKLEMMKWAVQRRPEE